MKKFISLLILVWILTNCSAGKIIDISTIDNNKTAYENYIITLENDEKIKAKYIFNRGDHIEVYKQGQSRLVSLLEVKNITGINNESKKGMLILGGTLVSAGIISMILINNGATVTHENAK